MKWIEGQYREVQKLAHEIRQTVFLLARVAYTGIDFFLECELPELLLWGRVAEEVLKEEQNV